MLTIRTSFIVLNTVIQKKFKMKSDAILYAWDIEASVSRHMLWNHHV